MAQTKISSVDQIPKVQLWNRQGIQMWSTHSLAVEQLWNRQGDQLWSRWQNRHEVRYIRLAHQVRRRWAGCNIKTILPSPIWRKYFNFASPNRKQRSPRCNIRRSFTFAKLAKVFSFSFAKSTLPRHEDLASSYVIPWVRNKTFNCVVDRLIKFEC